jgi:hypothetical protein
MRDDPVTDERPKILTVLDRLVAAGLSKERICPVSLLCALVKMWRTCSEVETCSGFGSVRQWYYRDPKNP